MKLFAGVDGGGTKTRALAVSEDGVCRGSALVGASNPNSVGAERARENLIESLCAAALSAGTVPKFEAGFLGISGVNDSGTAREMEKVVGADTRVVIDKLRIENDTRSLCAAAFPLSSGIVLIAGTGSKCYGRTLDGREWETGGYDFHVSDEASAFDLARRGLTAAVRAADGRGAPTILQKMLFDELRISEVGQISQRLHQDSLKHPGAPMSKDEIAALALIVGKAFESGDAVAAEIMRAAMCDLVRMVATVAKKLGLAGSRLSVALTGGVVLNEPGRTVFRDAMAREFPQCELFEPKFPPVVGAVVRALALGGIAITPEILANIERTFPRQ